MAKAAQRAELKTRPTNADVDAVLAAVEDPAKRADCEDLRRLMTEITGEEPRLWGPSIIGFGSYQFRHASGREGEWFLTGFAPRKQNLTVYIIAGFERYDDLLGRLGKHKIGKSCLYVKRLADLDRTVLEDLVRSSVEHLRATEAGADA